GADVLYFSGRDATSGQPGLFKRAGGAVTTVAGGDPFMDPSGVAVTRSGTVYVANSGSVDGGRAGILQVTGGQATEVARGLRAGFPAGIALTLDEHTLLVSAHDVTTGGDAVLSIDLSGSHATHSYDNGIADHVDAGGLHRARSTGVFSWADATVG